MSDPFDNMCKPSHIHDAWRVRLTASKMHFNSGGIGCDKRVDKRIEIKLDT